MLSGPARASPRSLTTPAAPWVCAAGESLVGNSPGRALAFTAAIGAPGAAASGGVAVDVHALPSKRTGLFAPQHASLIAR